MPVYLTTGLPGNYKSFFTLVTVEKRRKEEGRPVFYHGIPDVKLEGWTELEKGSDWINCPDGAIIVLDECQNTFPSLPLGKELPKHYAEVAVHRHRGFDLYLVTQAPLQFEAKIRRLVQTHWHMHRPFGMTKAVCFEWQDGVAENPKDYFARKNAVRKPFVPPKDFYGKYRSATMHTVKRSIPLKLFTIPALLVVLAVIGFFGYRHFAAMGFEPTAEKGAKSAQDKGAGGLMPGTAAPERKKTRDEYIAERQPRILGLPHTAPVYDAITQPMRAPVVAGCVVGKGHCTCYTDQGTVLDVEKTMCASIAAKGYFREFDTRSPSDGAFGSRSLAMSQTSVDPATAFRPNP